MKNQATEKPDPKPNLIAQLAEQKAQAQKNGGRSTKFGKFDERKPRFVEKGLLGPSWGGRNGQGKP